MYFVNPSSPSYDPVRPALPPGGPDGTGSGPAGRPGPRHGVDGSLHESDAIAAQLAEGELSALLQVLHDTRADRAHPGGPRATGTPLPSEVVR